MAYTIAVAGKGGVGKTTVCGINGIHLYDLNKYDDVARIVKESGIVDLI